MHVEVCRDVDRKAMKEADGLGAPTPEVLGDDRNDLEGRVITYLAVAAIELAELAVLRRSMAGADQAVAA